MNNSAFLVPLIVSCMLAGCADTPKADRAYGKAAMQMVEAQTFDPAAAANPPALAPDTGDGARLKNAVDEYRKDVAKGSEDVKQSIVFQVGSE